MPHIDNTPPRPTGWGVVSALSRVETKMYTEQEAARLTKLDGIISRVEAVAAEMRAVREELARGRTIADAAVDGAVEKVALVLPPGLSLSVSRDGWYHVVNAERTHWLHCQARENKYSWMPIVDWSMFDEVGFYWNANIAIQAALSAPPPPGADVDVDGAGK